MQTVQHPVFEDVTQTVADPAEWLEQGWLLADEPRNKAKPRDSVPTDR